MNPSAELKKPSKSENGESKQFPYRELIVCLMYVSVQTRPDIAYAVSKLARYFTNYDESHCNAAKNVAKYLNYAKGYSLIYGTNGSTEIKGYCDSDWAKDKETRKSTSGIAFTIDGTAFTWKSKLQSIVVLQPWKRNMWQCHCVQGRLYG